MLQRVWNADTFYGVGSLVEVMGFVDGGWETSFSNLTNVDERGVRFPGRGGQSLAAIECFYKYEIYVGLSQDNFI